MKTIFDRMKQEFHDRDYRHAYANGFVDSKIATQLKVLREQRELTQMELAEKAGMRQARISVLEDVNYSSWTLSTLRRLAKEYDLWVDVEVKEFGALWPQLKDFSRNFLERRSFEDDPTFHQTETAAFTQGQLTPAESSFHCLAGSLVISNLNVQGLMHDSPHGLNISMSRPVISHEEKEPVIARNVVLRQIVTPYCSMQVTQIEDTEGIKYERTATAA